MRHAGILIVEDEEIIAFDLRNRLTRLGYRVLGTFPRAEAALHFAASEPPELVLMDIMLEGGMDGVQAAKHFAEQQIPVVFLTASSDDETFERAKTAQPFGYIIKPFEENLLRITIEIALYKVGMEKKVRRNEERINKLNSCFLAFGPDPDRNIESLIDLTMDLFQADGAVYECRHGERAATVFLRGLPDGYRMAIGDPVPPLEPYLLDAAGIDPAMTALDVQCAFGHRISQAGGIEGAFLLVFKRAFAPDEQDRRLLGIMAAALGIEEERKMVEERSRQLQLQLIQSQKLESVGVMAGGVAHEINNPLMGIINYAQLVHERMPAEMDQLRSYCREIIHEGERIAGIVRNLLTFSRQERTEFEMAVPAAILETVLSLTRHFLEKEEITLDVQLAPDLRPIRCRRQQIEQVIINLVNNARDALNLRFPGIRDTKRLAIHVEKVDVDAGGSGSLRFRIRDNGCGIAPEIRNQVFDPFFSTKPKHLGTGLGLSVSYGIAVAHEGRLYFEPIPDGGTEFVMELPYSRASQESSTR